MVTADRGIAVFKSNRHFLALVVALSVLSSIGSSWALPRVQLVQSVPIETTLAQPDLPFAKDVWVEMIRSARRSVDLGQFYVANTENGLNSDLEPVLKELEAAGKRGVKVRFLLSDKMIQNDMPSYRRVQAIQGAEVRLYDISKL